jgi:hypothetical protein
MSTKAFERRYAQLMQEMQNHEHREEVLKLAMEQLCDEMSSFELLPSA